MKIKSIKSMISGIVATVLSISFLQAMEEVPYSVTIGNEVFTSEDTQMYIAHSGLEQFPMEIFSLERLELLDLKCNDIKSVPAEIGLLTALTTLDMSSNELNSIPLEIGMLTDLSMLLLDGNKLTVVPAEIGKLIKLEKLDLSDNKLITLPFAFNHLTRLSYLNLRGNPLIGDEAIFATCLENEDFITLSLFYKAREDAYDNICKKVFMLSYREWSVDNILVPKDILKYIRGMFLDLYALTR